ncbi:MAG TPA: hypothetical protein DET40_10555 [Lentisphaeria bacterium]|nr:MAG: hypothetical protein A2X45_09720 [Lentisphaerae bacterium GWF2_50_93]HCE43978.1 hypothetical protein [Lentisphaeria bacterium]
MKNILKYLKHWPALLFGAVVAAIFLVTIFSYQVKSTEVVILKTLGRISVQEEPGLHFCWPYPIDQIYRFDKRIHCFDGYEGKIEETSTADGQVVVASIYVAYRISDAGKFFKAAGGLHRTEVLLNDMMRSARNSAIGAHTLDEFINTGAGKVKLQIIEEEIRKELAREAMGKLGLAIDGVGFKSFILPDMITGKVFDRMKAERNVLAERYRADGKSDAKKLRDEADNKKSLALADAEAKAKNIKGGGDELAAKYYSVFLENPELAIFLRKLESLNRIKSGKITLIINSEGSPFNIMKEDKTGFSGKPNK